MLYYGCLYNNKRTFVTANTPTVRGGLYVDSESVASFRSDYLKDLGCRDPYYVVQWLL